jgi:alcohol dehydrogenase
MKKTYRAMQVTRPGTLELVDRAVPEPGDGEVLIQVEACGICGADAGAIEGLEPAVKYPRVPGHEVVGRITATDRGGFGGFVAIKLNRHYGARCSLAIR